VVISFFLNLFPHASTFHSIIAPMLITPTAYTSPPFTVDLKEHLNQSEIINTAFGIQIKGKKATASLLCFSTYAFSFFLQKESIW
jgi:hypothetical protein